MQNLKHLRTLAELALIATMFALFVFLGVAMLDPACGASGDSQTACAIDIVTDTLNLLPR
jgi:hypothetical protein